MLVLKPRRHWSTVLWHRWQTDALPIVGQLTLAPWLRKHRSLLLLCNHLKLLVSLHDLLVAEIGQLLHAWLVEDWLSALINTNELLLDFVVIRLVTILQGTNVIENVFDLLNAFRFVHD